ncbi:MAG: hypothetical protein ACLRZG_06260 [Streptococcus sp.]
MPCLGKGVHVVTVNEYLTERDATEMGELLLMAWPFSRDQPGSKISS